MTGLRNHYKATKIEHVEVTQGDTFAFGVKITFDEDPQELDGATFTVREIDGGNFSKVRKTLGDGIELDHIDGNDVYYRVRVAPSETEELNLGDYRYDFEISINDDVYTLLKGIFRVTFQESKEGWI